MQPDRPVVLLEPQRSTETNSHGEPVMAAPLRHRLFARRLDRGGRERIDAEVWVAEANTRWTVREGVLPRRPRAKWRLETQDGDSHEVVHVAEAILPGMQTRGGFLWLYTVLRS